MLLFRIMTPLHHGLPGLAQSSSLSPGASGHVPGKAWAPSISPPNQTPSSHLCSQSPPHHDLCMPEAPRPPLCGNDIAWREAWFSGVFFARGVKSRGLMERDVQWSFAVRPPSPGQSCSLSPCAFLLAPRLLIGQTQAGVPSWDLSFPVMPLHSLCSLCCGSVAQSPCCTPVAGCSAPEASVDVFSSRPSL